jgi:hypothetical protein
MIWPAVGAEYAEQFAAVAHGSRAVLPLRAALALHA